MCYIIMLHQMPLLNRIAALKNVCQKTLSQFIAARCRFKSLKLFLLLLGLFVVVVVFQWTNSLMYVLQVIMCLYHDMLSIRKKNSVS